MTATQHKLLNKTGYVLLGVTGVVTVTELVEFLLNRSHATPYYLVALFAVAVLLTESKSTSG